MKLISTFTILTGLTLSMSFSSPSKADLYPWNSPMFVKFTQTSQNMVTLEVCDVSNSSQCMPKLVGGRAFTLDEINQTINKINSTNFSFGQQLILVGGSITLGSAAGSVVPVIGTTAGGVAMGFLSLYKVVSTDSQVSSATNGLTSRHVSFAGGLSTILNLLAKNLPK